MRFSRRASARACFRFGKHPARTMVDRVTFRRRASAASVAVQGSRTSARAIHAPLSTKAASRCRIRARRGRCRDPSRVASVFRPRWRRVPPMRLQNDFPDCLANELRDAASGARRGLAQRGELFLAQVDLALFHICHGGSQTDICQGTPPSFYMAAIHFFSYSVRPFRSPKTCSKSEASDSPPVTRRCWSACPRTPTR